MKKNTVVLVSYNLRPWSIYIDECAWSNTTPANIWILCVPLPSCTTINFFDEGRELLHTCMQPNWTAIADVHVYTRKSPLFFLVRTSHKKKKIELESTCFRACIYTTSLLSYLILFLASTLILGSKKLEIRTLIQKIPSIPTLIKKRTSWSSKFSTCIIYG